MPVAGLWLDFQPQDFLRESTTSELQALGPQSGGFLRDFVVVSLLVVHGLRLLCLPIFLGGASLLDVNGICEVVRGCPGMKANGAKKFIGTKSFRSWGSISQRLTRLRLCVIDFFWMILDLEHVSCHYFRMLFCNHNCFEERSLYQRHPSQLPSVRFQKTFEWQLAI